MYLTVPVREHFGDRIVDMVIADDIWRTKYWKSLAACYGRAPYFAAFRDAMAEVYERPWDKLVDLNLAMLEGWLALLSIATRVVRSSEMDIAGGATPRLVVILGRLGPSTYISGDFAAGNHMDDALLAGACISVEMQAWQAPVYRQQFPKSGFIADLAIVDLYCNEGPRALEIPTTRETSSAAPA